MFTKNDLKTGMFGVMTNGMMFVIVGDHIVYQKDGYDVVSNLRNDLSTAYRTIDKVYDGCYSFNHLEKLLKDIAFTKANLVYDRERDTKKYYNGKVICVNDCNLPSDLTVGKIYEFVNGCCENNLGGQITGSPVEDINDLNHRFYIKCFIPLVE